jgi:hypothetical protein
MQFQQREESEEEDALLPQDMELLQPGASQSSSQQDAVPRRSGRSRNEHYSPFGEEFM